MPRILILHATVGTGHKRAALALEAAFTSLDASCDVHVVDVLDYTPKIFRLGYAQAWIELTDHAPLIWGYFYTQSNNDPDIAKITNDIRKLIESVGTNDLKNVLKEIQPDCIICTHFLPMELLVRLKRKDRLPQPIYCVITDHAAHTFWTYTNIDGYFVGDTQTRDQLIQRGVAHEKITVTGIPIDPAIAIPKDATSLRRQHMLPTDTAVIVLFGGGVSNERIRIIAEDILHSGMAGTLIVVAGRNQTLVDALVDLESSATMNLQVLGFITYVDDLITASDLVITKAGGLIISEVLARGIPLIVIDPIPGHEEWNADYVVSHMAGVQLRMAQSVAATVQTLLGNDLMLRHMRAQALALGYPHAARDIARAIVRADAE